MYDLYRNRKQAMTFYDQYFYTIVLLVGSISVWIVKRSVIILSNPCFNVQLDI